MATGQNFVPPLPLTQPTACRLFDPPYPPKTDSFARDPLRNHRHLAIAPLRGDLDWIVMKTLEKDRTRRYETANALAMDIQRHLNNEPVMARPPSSLYRFQKLVRRNKLAFAAASAVAAALVMGFGISTVLFVRE